MPPILSLSPASPIAPSVHVQVLQTLSDQRQRIEQELLKNRFPLPLQHRIAWAEVHPSAESWFFAVVEDAQCRAGFAVEINRSRALPGHLLVRAERFGAGMDADSIHVAIESICDLAHSNKRILRVNVETFARETINRLDLARAMGRFGFRPVQTPRSYTNTIAIDLRPAESEIFASFRGSVRRNVRAIAKHPLCIRPIDEPALATRLQHLLAQAMVRTRGDIHSHDWENLIALARQHPELVRLVGLFRTDRSGPDALLSFACGHFHGDYCHYDVAGSTRESDLHVPLGYSLIWDLICWAKRNGAAWFDLGGITAGHAGDPADPVGGISDFKRHFGQNEIPVGGEWILEPRPMRGRLARAVSSSAAWLSRFRLS